MRPAGYSTGAVCGADFKKALMLLASTDADAVELSALRLPELEPLMAAAESLDVTRFKHVSIHAPSKFDAVDEARVIALLQVAAKRNWPVVAHPDAFHDVKLWASLGESLCIENMDKRKPVGRTLEELSGVFAELPNARLCFDFAHARQYDGSMIEAYRILREFGTRIVQVHVSEVNTNSRHVVMSDAALADFRDVADFIPITAAIIVESQVGTEDDALKHELMRARSVFDHVDADFAI